MQALFFEQPLPLALLLLGLLLVLAIVWSRRRTPGSRKLLIGMALASPLLLGLQAVVETDRERITSVCRKLGESAEQGDIELFRSLIAADFRAEGGAAPIDREALAQLVAQALTRYHLERVRISSIDVLFEGQTAAAEFAATARVSTAEQVIDPVASRWRVRLHQREGAWRVYDLEPVPGPFWPFRRLSELR